MSYTSKLWKLAFLTFPLLSISYFRFTLGPFEMPIFIIILSIAVMYYFFRICIGNNNLIISFNKTQNLFLLAFLFFLALHIFNTIRSLNIERAISQQIKFFVAFLTFIAISIFFPKDRKLLKEVINLVIVLSTVLLLIYIYRSFFVLNLPYLTTHLDEISRQHRNQMGFYLALITPLVLWRYIYSGLFSLWSIPIITHVFAVFYTMSRGMWISFFLSLIAILCLFIVKRVKWKLVFSIFIGIVILGVMFSFFYFSDAYSHTETFQQRVQGLLRLQDYGKEHSISERKIFIQKGIALFFDSPILGTGTSNFLAQFNYVSHNDYVQILYEQGILGIIIFLFMISLVIREIFRLKNDSWDTIGLKQSSLAIIFYLNFINAYKIIIVYVILALLFGLKDTKA